jgi:non-specific serine/threonine protein kinase
VAPECLQDVDLVVTCYASLLRIPWITDSSWNLLVLDEARAIENPSAKRTQTG